MTEKEREVQPYSDYKGALNRGFIETEIPNHVSNNIKYDLRYYQREACSFFNYYMDEERNRTKPDHLMYHMATGSGKTVVMGCNIIELYKRGYRNFVFFVDKSNIVEKTKANFLKKSESKYIFTEYLEVEGEKVRIEEVENFETNPSDINIKFSTIQGLHEELNNPKENSTTYQDLAENKIVLISDEAHHINASTKSEERKKNTWEGTVNKILDQNDDNILLEFTATAGLNNDNIYQKYKNKIIYQYSLKQFRKDRFSKEVKVLQSDTDALNRAMQSVILSQYRRKVATNNGLSNFKPVILIKSRTISNSEEHQEKFESMISSLDEKELEKVRNNSSGVIERAFEYFDSYDISLQNLAYEIKQEFGRENTISVNSSKEDTSERRVVVNTLEDNNNNIRVVFAVDKLNEGWDVLNLFDIVRMYDKSSSGSGPLKTTIKEAQLIGRGARYRPFKINEDQDEFKRKYDNDTGNELRVLEELYYHSKNNPDYIQNLKSALVKEGIVPNEKKEVELNVKDEFKQSELWDGNLFINKKKEKKEKDLENLKSIDSELRFVYETPTGQSGEVRILDDIEDYNNQKEKKANKHSLSDLPENILRVAVQSSRFHKYNNLNSYFRNLESTFQFIESEDFLGYVKVEIRGIKLEHMNAEQKLNLAKSILSSLEKKIKNSVTEYEGTEKFYRTKISDVVRDKTRNIHIDEDSDAERGHPMSNPKNDELKMNLSKKNWYVYNENYGTSQEKYMIRFINDSMDNIRQRYDSVYLIRNASLFKIHRFKDGKSIEPDFVMLASQNDQSKLYQLFIEPKGDGFIDKDKWKEEFLIGIRDNFEIEDMYEDDKFELVGLPFYNENMKSRFEEELGNVLDIESLY